MSGCAFIKAACLEYTVIINKLSNNIPCVGTKHLKENPGEILEWNVRMSCVAVVIKIMCFKNKNIPWIGTELFVYIVNEILNHNARMSCVAFKIELKYLEH